MFSLLNKLPDIPIEGQDKNPFLSHAFLALLEKHHCVGKQTGWQVSHIYQPSQQFLLPTYIKSHSYGEYVFDWSWADAYQRNGLAYYPKLLSALPFTPVAGDKHTGPQLDQNKAQTLAEFAKTQCYDRNLSGWHFNFIDKHTANTIASQNMHIRKGVQFEWHNNQEKPYNSFDDYLSHFTARKRKQVKQERKKALTQVDNIAFISAKEMNDKQLKAFYHCYQANYTKRGQQGYLTYAFFADLIQHLPNNIALCYAEKKTINGKMNIVACALFFLDQQSLYGRYWGALEDLPCLHFELCYYQGIEFAIKHRLSRFNPGTQGEHKIKRGFVPTYSYSAHWLSHSVFNRAVQSFCIQETEQLARYKQQCETLLPFKVQL